MLHDFWCCPACTCLHICRVTLQRPNYHGRLYVVLRLQDQHQEVTSTGVCPSVKRFFGHTCEVHGQLHVMTSLLDTCRCLTCCCLATMRCWSMGLTSMQLLCMWPSCVLDSWRCQRKKGQRMWCSAGGDASSHGRQVAHAGPLASLQPRVAFILRLCHLVCILLCCESIETLLCMLLLKNEAYTG